VLNIILNYCIKKKQRVVRTVYELKSNQTIIHKKKNKIVKKLNKYKIITVVWRKLQLKCFYDNIY